MLQRFIKIKIIIEFFNNQLYWIVYFITLLCLTLCSSIPGFPALHLSPGACSNSCPLSPWCNLTISSSVAHFFSCPQSFPTSGSFPMSWLFTLGGQSIRAPTSAWVLPMSIQGWFPLDWLVWSPCCPRDSQESSPAPQFEGINFLALSLLYGPPLTSIHDPWKNECFVNKEMSLLFNALWSFLIAFLPKSQCLLISWLQSLSAMILESKKIKPVTVSIIFPSIYYEVMALDVIVLVFWMLSFKPNFHSSLSLSTRGSSVPLCLLP